MGSRVQVSEMGEVVVRFEVIVKLVHSRKSSPRGVREGVGITLDKVIDKAIQGGWSYAMIGKEKVHISS